MWGGVRITTPAAELPLTAAELRARLRIDDDAQDTLLGDYLAAAAAAIEGPNGAGVAMMAQTWTLTRAGFARDMILPGWPVSALTAITYLDTEGAEQSLDLATYRLANGLDPARLILAPGASLPATLAGPGTVAIQYSLGCASAAAVDPGLVTALALLAGHYFENREAAAPGTMGEIPLGVSHILARFARGCLS